MTDEKIAKLTADEAKDLIESLGFSGEIAVDISVGENERKYVTVEIEGDDLALLIGFQGKTLKAMEHIVALIVNRKLEGEGKDFERIRVRIDVNKYRAKREDYIRDVAIKAIDQAKESAQEIELPEMDPAERRIVHMVVKEEQGVTSESKGDEGQRHIFIKPE